MITFPRDTPDKIRIDGDEVEFTPSELDEVSSVPLRSRSFNEAIIETHCSRCLKKHKLKYSDTFPSRISFVCSECEKKNKVVNIRRDGRNYTRLSELTRRMKRRVRKRESRLAGMKYGSQRPEEIQSIASDYDSTKRKHILTLLTWAISAIITFLVLSLSLAVITSIITFIGSLLLVRGVKTNIPEDPYIELRSRHFIDGMKSRDQIADEFQIEESSQNSENKEKTKELN